MKTQQFSNKHAHSVLVGMVTNKDVISRLHNKWERNSFPSPGENTIAEWCVEHWKKYKEPLGRQIENVFRVKMEGRTDAEVTMVERFLVSLSDEYERNGDAPNSEYICDLAVEVWDRNRLLKMLEDARDLVIHGELSEAKSEIRDYREVQMGPQSVIKPGEDVDIWQNLADAGEPKSLISWPNALGKYINDEYIREAFVAVLAATGRGKSWWLVDSAYRAVRQRNRVAFFEVGDMTTNQVMRRLAMRVCRQPGWDRYRSFQYPLDWIIDDKAKTLDVKFEERTKKIVNEISAYREWKKIQQGRDRFRLSCHSSGSISVPEIDTILRDWAHQDGWVPDVVIIDYADLLAWPSGISDERTATNESWLGLRRMSQDWHCLVLTASQADAQSYERGTLGLGNFSLDRRKNDHVTAVMSLDSRPEEQVKSIYRVNWMKRRDSEQTKGGCTVASCLSMGMPVVLSRSGYLKVSGKIS